MLKTLSRWIKGLALLLWLVVMLLVGFKLASQNQAMVEFTLLFWQLPKLSAGVLFGLSLLVGVLLGILACMPGLFVMRRKLRVANKLIRQHEEAPRNAILPKAD